MNESYSGTKSFFETNKQWMAIVLLAAVAVWLWVSWRNAWFPFTVPAAMAPAAGTPALQTQEGVLHSLSATSSPKSSPAPVLKGLTPPASSKAPSANTQTILDSLTPKK